MPLLGEDLAFVQGLQLTNLGDDELAGGLRSASLGQGVSAAGQRAQTLQLTRSLVDDHCNV